MAFHAMATRQTTTGGTSLVTTVPTGVTDAMFGLILVTGATNATNETPVGVTVSSNAPSETITTLEAPDSDNNMWEATYKITGVEAGETITTAIDNARAYQVDIMFVTVDFDLMGTIQFKGGTTASSVTAPAVACQIGQRIFAVGRDRSPSQTDTYTGTNSRGLTVTQRYDADNAASPNCGVWIGEFIADATTSGTTTVAEDNGASSTGNGSAFHITERINAITLDLTDDVGLDDTVGNFSISIEQSLVEQMGLSDGISIEIQSNESLGLTDTLNISDPITIDLVVAPDVLIFTEDVGLSDSISFVLLGPGEGTSYVGSKADQVAAWLRSLGYTGSINTMQYKFLLDEYTLAFGAPARPLSAKDMARALNKTLKHLLVISEWP